MKKNDSLWRIAQRELGDGLLHERILEWNPALLRTLLTYPLSGALQQAVVFGYLYPRSQRLVGEPPIPPLIDEATGLVPILAPFFDAGASAVAVQTLSPTTLSAGSDSLVDALASRYPIDRPADARTSWMCARKRRASTSPGTSRMVRSTASSAIL